MKNLAIRIAAAMLAASAGSALAQTTGPASPGASGEEVATEAPPQKTDPSVAKEDITRALRDTAEVGVDTISVSVHADTVVLSGEVESEAQAARAHSLAQEHGAGIRVSNHIEVRPQAPTPDQAVASTLVHDVEQALKQDRRTTNLGIAITIDDKMMISLHGLVPSRDSRAAAEEIAAGVEGVQRVNSRLVVPGE